MTVACTVLKYICCGFWSLYRVTICDYYDVWNCIHYFKENMLEQITYNKIWCNTDLHVLFLPSTKIYYNIKAVRQWIFSKVLYHKSISSEYNISLSPPFSLNSQLAPFVQYPIYCKLFLAHIFVQWSSPIFSASPPITIYIKNSASVISRQSWRLIPSCEVWNTLQLAPTKHCLKEAPLTKKVAAEKKRSMVPRKRFRTNF